MRWALVKVCLAVTAMVVVAFAVPLGLVIKEMARDRAFSNAERQAAAERVIAARQALVAPDVLRAALSGDAPVDFGRRLVYVSYVSRAAAVSSQASVDLPLPLVPVTMIAGLLFMPC